MTPTDGAGLIRNPILPGFHPDPAILRVGVAWLVGFVLLVPLFLTGQELNEEKFRAATSGIDISPGRWRPLFRTEHIAWVSPPWPSQEYVSLDFPEAVFYDGELVFLSHIHPRFPSRYDAQLPEVAWRRVADGVDFERALPDGVRFGGSVRRKSETAVALRIWLENGTAKTLRAVKMQTCAYLRGIREFARETNANKLVHVAGEGWVSLDQAGTLEDRGSPWRVGWLDGPGVVDRPWIVTPSQAGDRLVAMTWFDDSYSMIGNEAHPCMHVDPVLPDLEPGTSHTIEGELVFFEGTLEAFTRLLPNLKSAGP